MARPTCPAFVAKQQAITAPAQRHFDKLKSIANGTVFRATTRSPHAANTANLDFVPNFSLAFLALHSILFREETLLL
jgi:hypothetical protein